MNLKDEMSWIKCLLTEEGTDIIGTWFGYAVCFNQSAVRGMSCIATSVRGVNLRDGDTVVGASVITELRRGPYHH